MKNSFIKAISFLTVVALSSISIATIATANPIENNTNDCTTALSAEKTALHKTINKAEAFSECALDKEYVKDDFKYSGFKKSDLRVVAERQSAIMPRSISSEQAKEYIYDRMLNTMDFYKTLKGSYIHCQYLNNTKFTVDYAVLNGENPKCYEKLKYEGEDSYKENVYSDSLVVETKISPDKTQQLNSRVLVAKDDKENDTVAIVKSKSRKQIDSEGIPVWHYRIETNGLTYSRESLSPQEMTLGFLNNFSTWNIESQENYLGRACYVIAGKLGGSYGAKLNTEDFKLWVDVETGVLLKSEQYNSDGKLVESITTTEFTANEELSDRDFKATTK